MQHFDAEQTASLLPIRHLVSALSDVFREYDAGGIDCPERLAVPRADGTGLLMSMPCQAADLVVHKLLSIYGANPSRGLPAIQGQVTCFDAGGWDAPLRARRPDSDGASDGGRHHDRDRSPPP